MNKKVKLAALQILSVYLVFFVVIPAMALSAGGVGGFPTNSDKALKFSDSWFIYNLSPGESKEDSITIINNSDEDQTIKLYAVDSLATGDGNFSLKAESDEQSDVGSWIELSAELVTLRPAEKRAVPFTIEIAQNATVGEHSGGIIIQGATNSADIEGPANAVIQTRVGIRIYQTVPGEIIRDIELENFSVASQETENGMSSYIINLTAKNKSNVTLNATANLQIYGWGKNSYFFSKDEDKKGIIDLSNMTDFFKGEKFSQEWQLLRDKSVTTHWEWEKPKFGHYVIQAVISYEGTDGPQNLVSPVIEIWIIPWTELGIVGVIILALLILLVFLMKGANTRKWKRYTVRQGDQLQEIAHEAGIGWKKLAKANKLKSPFVKKGQSILVPASFKGGVDKKVVVKKSATKKVAKKNQLKVGHPFGGKKSRLRKRSQLPKSLKNLDL